jgi:hypothetical protein
MIRKLLTSGFILAAAFTASAQQAPKKKFNIKERFISSFGLTYSTFQNSSSEALYGVNATPSLNLLNSFSDFSISLAINAAAGFHPSSDNDSLEYYSYSIPAFIQVNAGHLASQDFYAALGLFVGAGYNLSTVNGQSENGFSWTTGFRFWFLKQSFTARYIQSHLSESENRLHELSLQVNVGRYLRQVKDNNKLSKFVSPFNK